jgi:peroxiredoxin
VSPNVRRFRPEILSLLALAACASSSATMHAEGPLWERPGLGGAVRPEMGAPQPGMMAPDFELSGQDGATTRLASLRGGWVVLHFTASWCPYCDAEVEHLGEMARDYAPSGVRVVLVDVEDPEPVWSAYAAAHVAPEILALHDASGAAAASYAPPGAQPSFVDRAQVALDATLLVDPAGAIRLFLLPDSAHFDPTFRAVRAELDRLLADAPPRALAPEDIVRVTLAPDPVHGAIAIRLRIAPGYHIMSDRPSAPEYIPTRVELSAPDLDVGEARYPAPVAFDVGERSIATFQGDTVIVVPVTAQAGAARNVTARIRYQACTATRCLFPTTRTTEALLAFGTAQPTVAEKRP